MILIQNCFTKEQNVDRSRTGIPKACTGLTISGTTQNEINLGNNYHSKSSLRLRVSVVPTHLIAVRLLLDIGKKFLRQVLNWNSPLKICALYIRIIRTMGQGQSERNIEIALTACLWRPKYTADPGKFCREIRKSQWLRSQYVSQTSKSSLRP